MRSREQIENDGMTLGGKVSCVKEVLLDIRDILLDLKSTYKGGKHRDARNK